MNLPAVQTAFWKSAELLIAFHKNRDKSKRSEPYLWRAKNAFARLLAKPEDQEAFILLKGEGDQEDVQIKLHPDKIVVRRDQVLGWSGIFIDPDFIRVKVDDMWIRINADGSVVAQRGDLETTYLEGDGSIIKVNPHSEIMVSRDGSSMSRRTEDQFDAFTENGFMSKKTTRSAP